MKETIIQKQLDNLFPDSNLEFQVVYQVPYLKVAINYYSTLSFDRATLRHGIQRTLSELDLPDDIEYLALYTRPINQTDPDWSTCVRLSAAKDSQDLNRDEPSASQKNNTSEQEEGVTARETESEQPIAREQSQDNHSPETAEQETSLNKQLSDYCFIRNRNLLKQEIVAPPLPVAELVTSFHELSASEKQQLLPMMSQLLKQKKPEGIEDVSAQQWIEKLFAVNQQDLRKTAIWLSRYCYNPEETIAQLKNNKKQSDKSEAKEQPEVEEQPENDNTTQSTIAHKSNKAETPKTNQVYRDSKLKEKSQDLSIKIDENFKTTGKILKSNWKDLLKLFLFLILPIQVLLPLLIIPINQNSVEFLMAPFIMISIIGAIFYMLSMLATILITERTVKQQKINIKNILLKTTNKIPILLIVSLVVALLGGLVILPVALIFSFIPLLGGIAMLVVPILTIYMVIKLIFLGQAIILRNCGLNAIDYSMKLVKTNWWRIFQHVVLMQIIAIIIAMIFSMISTLINLILFVVLNQFGFDFDGFFAFTKTPFPRFFFGLFSSILTTLMNYFFMVSITVLFLDLESQKWPHPI